MGILAVESIDTVRARFLALSGSRAPGLTAACAMEPDELALHQQQEWEAALADARAVSPWHAARLAGLPSDAPPASVPTMTRRDLAARFDHIVGTPGAGARWAEALVRAGDGPVVTDGGRLVVAADRRTPGGDLTAWSLPDVVGLHLAVLRWLLRGPTGGVAPRRTAAVGAAPRGLSAALVRLAGGTVVPADRDPAAIADRLNGIQPDLLAASAALVAPLARQADAGRLTLRPRALVAAGPLAPGARRAALAAWGIEPVEVYAEAACGVVATGCGWAGGLHVNEDLVLVEALDPAGRPVAGGERAARVLVTPLGGGHALPLLRYELGATAVLWPGPCPCGSGFRRLGEIRSR